jgi:hypothetical protein
MAQQIFRSLNKIYLDQNMTERTDLRVTATVGPYSNAQGTVWLICPFNPAEYEASIAFTLANGETPDEVGMTAINNTELVDGDTWYIYKYQLTTGETINPSKTQEAELLFNAIIRESADQSNKFTQTTSSVIPIGIGGEAPENVLPPDEVARIDGELGNKRDKNPTGLTTKSTPSASDQFTFYGNTEAGERKIGFEDLKNAIVEDVVGRIAYTTLVDSGITDPVAGFTNFRKLVESTLDPDYPTAGGQIDFTTTLVDTYEEITSSIYPLGFFRGTNLTNLQFTNSFTLKTTSGTATIKIDYYKVDNPDDLTGTLLGSTEITFTNTDFTLQSKGGVLAGPFSIDPDVGETIVGRVYGKASASGVTLSAQVGGVEPKTFTSWNIPSGDFSASKMNVILNPVEGNIIEQQADGNTKDAGVAVTNLALLDAIQSFLAKITFTDDVDIAQDLLVNGVVTVGGNLIVNGTTTTVNSTTVEVEDNVMKLAKGQTSGLVDIGIEGERGSDTNVFMGWQESTDLFKIGLVGSLERIATIVDSPNINEIFIYDGNKLVTQTSAQIKSLLNIGISDVSGLQTALNNKIEHIKLFVDGTPVGANEFDELNFLFGATATEDGTNSRRANIGVIGQGTGEGEIVLSEIDADPNLTVGITETLLSWNTIRQSTDTTTFELFDKLDGTIPNTVRLYKTEDAVGTGNVFYRVTYFVTATNTNTNNPVNVTLNVKKDNVLVSEATVTARVGEASVSKDTVNNFVLMAYVETDLNDAQEDLQFYYEADDTGVTIDIEKIKVESMYTTGGTTAILMTTDVYDPDRDGVVTKALQDTNGNQIDTTYETITNVDTLKGVGWVDETVKGNADAISELQNPTIDEETVSFTLALDDDGEVLKVNSASAVVVTVPLNSNVAFPIGTQIAIYRNGAGTVTLAPESTVVINSAESKLAILNQYGSVALLKTGTDEWLLVGSLE